MALEEINFYSPLDFQKAFDKVCHKRLMMKIETMGIGGKVRKWLEDWLKGRKQRVRVEGEYSKWEEVRSSVIQGSVLGGVLFDIYINDIVEAIIEALIKIFADDTKVARIVESQEDGDKMQQVIDSLEKWATNWEMTFNAKKCKILHVGNQNPMHEYTLYGERITETSEEKDLGVWTERSLKPTKQCAAAARSANFALGQIKRAFHFRNKRDMVPLWKTFVRPKLEFGVAAWCPWQEGDMKIMEKIQERFVKMLSDVRGETYEDRLSNAGLTTLKERRARGDLIEAFKTLKGLNNVDKQKWFEIKGEAAKSTRATTIVTETGESRRENALGVEGARTEVRKNSYTVRTAKAWNKLPDELRNQKTVNGFKNAYDAWIMRRKNLTKDSS